MPTWIDPDGLERRYGTDRAKPSLQGEFRYEGPVRCMEIHATYDQFPLVADNSVVIKDNYTLPKGSIVERVEISCPVDFTSAGSAMTLNVGWVNTDRTNGIDVDAFVVAATQAEMNAGGVNIAGWVGAEVGNVKTTVPKLITWEVDSAAATAGEAYIRLYYSVS